MNFDLSGKNILVTGASSGIGRATAIECAKAGANVIICGRNASRLASTASAIANASVICGDLTDTVFRESIIDFLNGNKLDGLALVAGMVDVAPIAFTTIEKISTMMHTNFLANSELIRLLLKKKVLKRGSSVVAVTSVLGIDGFKPGNACYGVSKAALESWIKYCALEYASKGIRFNTIHPGSVETPMLSLNSITDEQMAIEISRIPIKRLGQPEDIAGSVIYLLSDVSSFITGTSIIVDGGQHLLF